MTRKADSLIMYRHHKWMRMEWECVSRRSSSRPGSGEGVSQGSCMSIVHCCSSLSDVLVYRRWQASTTCLIVRHLAQIMMLPIVNHLVHLLPRVMAWRKLAISTMNSTFHKTPIILRAFHHNIEMSTSPHTYQSSRVNGKWLSPRSGLAKSA